MNNYAVQNSSYPGPCGTAHEWQIVADARQPPSSRLSRQLQVNTPLTLSLEEAIQCCDRHVYITGKPPNPLAFVQEFLNLLRWEISELWDITGNPASLRRTTRHALTPEHYQRSGELLAEGIALSLLTKRLGIPRQRFFFYKGQGARPDFVIGLKGRYSRGLILGRRKWHLEVRLRHNQRNLHLQDLDELKLKKGGAFKGAIAVYIMHGEGQHQDLTPRTRIHVADPESTEVGIATKTEIALSAMIYYRNIVSQIGLWDYRDHLTTAIMAAKHRRLLRTTMPRPAPNELRTSIGRDIAGEEFRGRVFNSLVYEAGRQPLSLEQRTDIRRQAWSRVDAGDFGTNTFRGLSTQVLGLIENNDWTELSTYQHPELAPESGEGTIRADGLAEGNSPVLAGSPGAEEISNQLPLRP